MDIKLSSDDIARYARQIKLTELGEQGQLKLKNARVLIVGCGGLGVPAASTLAAMGFGKISLCDGDLVSLTNLHRQTFYSEQDIGKAKVLCLKERLHQLNSSIHIETLESWFDINNATDLLRNVDLVIDGSDNFRTRYLLNDACYLKGIPLVYGAVNAFEGHVSFFPMEKGSAHYRDLFPTPPEDGAVGNCEENGVIGVLPNIIGQLQAAEAVKYFINFGSNLTSKLLIYDFIQSQFHTIKYKAQTGYPIEHLEPELSTRCLVHELSWTSALEEADKGKLVLIDVRTAEERKSKHMGGKHIEVSQIEESISQFNHETNYAFYCQSGRRSQIAIQMLLDRGFSGKCFNIRGGMEMLPTNAHFSNR
jgi:adenylyltransferase/sulfurtransferase